MRFDKSGNLAKKICKEFTIDEHYSKKVTFLVGIDVLHEVQQERQSSGGGGGVSENVKK